MVLTSFMLFIYDKLHEQSVTLALSHTRQGGFCFVTNVSLSCVGGQGKSDMDKLDVQWQRWLPHPGCYALEKSLLWLVDVLQADAGSFSLDGHTQTHHQTHDNHARIHTINALTMICHTLAYQLSLSFRH